MRQRVGGYLQELQECAKFGTGFVLAAHALLPLVGLGGCEEMIPKMIEAGTDIFRLNCSHRRGGDFERVYPLIRKTAKELGKKVTEPKLVQVLGW